MAGLASVPKRMIAISVLPLTLSAGAILGLAHSAPGGADESRCVRMLAGAPEHIRLLEAVQSCLHVDAGCAYLEPTPGYGVLTLMCPEVVQVIFADRLRSLHFREGAWAGDCSSGSWQLGPALPGCYPDRQAP